ncbi:agmatine/peptidylarginine deiminase [Pseudomonas sp. GV071]|jgi:agmatine deiminase|uniref:agmatine deiminase family protein n=1 Tax=Pseudomonas sp. GV071 TaxID=2135754 RepID=UPI000D37B671|nr:agmatine deiminase family protein [Pseudomonas sp. GV071]PTQ73613.1 agmatine deiminase [Pseudomonas sp. GV071]
MATRRDFIKQLSTVAGLGIASSLGLSFRATPVQAAPGLGDDWYVQEESLPQLRAFVAFGAQPAIWDDWTADVQDCIARIAKAIAQFQPVTVLCRSNELALAKRKCGTTNMRFLTTPLDDVWIRDSGANFAVDEQGGLYAIDFNFSGWGGKQQHANDAQVASLMSSDAKATYIRSQLTGEGGGIEVDGNGTAIMTESCWVNSNRNPGWSKAQVDAELKAMLGLRKIIWLPGIKGKDITDAHVDFYARFVKPGVVIANLDNDPASYDYAVTRTHLEILKTATDADGKRLQIHTLSPPRTLRSNKFTRDNPDFAPGYINYFPVNGGIIAPQFGDASADAASKALLEKLYPGRKVVQLNIDAVAAGGGGIHCVTQQQPRV